MPVLMFDDYRIDFKCEGDGSPLILHHGFAQWAEDWREAGWTDAFAASYTVVTFDALGHGRSDRPHDRTAYKIENRARAVLALADELRLERFSLFGFSMGGRAAFEVAASHPERLRSLVVGGMHPRAPELDRQNLERRIRTLRSGRLQLLERAIGATSKRPANDPEVLALTTEAHLEWRGAEDRLGSITMPALLFCGEQDPLFPDARKTASAMPNARFLALQGQNHSASFYKGRLALPEVLRFLDRAHADGI